MAVVPANGSTPFSVNHAGIGSLITSDLFELPFLMSLILTPVLYKRSHFSDFVPLRATILHINSFQMPAGGVPSDASAARLLPTLSQANPTQRETRRGAIRTTGAPLKGFRQTE